MLSKQSHAKEKPRMTLVIKPGMQPDNKRCKQPIKKRACLEKINSELNRRFWHDQMEEQAMGRLTMGLLNNEDIASHISPTFPRSRFPRGRVKKVRSARPPVAWGIPKGATFV